VRQEPADMLWAKWVAAATIPMTRGVACNKIAVVTNSLGAVSLRGAAMRIIGVLTEVLRIDCNENQDMDVSASSADPC